MNISAPDTWERFLAYYKEYPSLGISMDLSRVEWPDGFFSSMQSKVEDAFNAMTDLEKGAIANPDENRMVGHYWLRAPELAPEPQITHEISRTLEKIKAFTHKVHSGQLRGEKGGFRNLIVIGIGGSALGPLFVSSALKHPDTDKLSFFILDNTDPDGMDRVFARIGGDLGRTLCVVVSKSGGTKETRNGMVETRMAYERSGLRFERHAVAITQKGSQLDQVAVSDQWIERFPMWDWVGGRTSELSAVGLLPAALQGFDIDNLLNGAREMDVITRTSALEANPAMGMALAWYAAGNGRGDKNLVILPYKDRLELFSKYLQQLIMESIGKQLDLKGNEVLQGLTVLGNKGSTDQHSFVQQLRDGRNDFLVTFIEVLRDRSRPSPQLEAGLTSADYLQGFLLGTRTALAENQRQSITITISDVVPYSIGALIALFERTVGFYASLVGINAYHQPGVEAGKKAATEVVTLKTRVANLLHSIPGQGLTAHAIADRLNANTHKETIYKICKRLAANEDSGITAKKADSPEKVCFSA